MALRDHFAEGSRPSPPAVDCDIAGSTDAMPVSQVVVNDQWALEYMTVVRIQPLIEAIDDDVSSFITVAEVNAFTAARPSNWR